MLLEAGLRVTRNIGSACRLNRVQRYVADRLRLYVVSKSLNICVGRYPGQAEPWRKIGLPQTILDEKKVRPLGHEKFAD